MKNNKEDLSPLQSFSPDPEIVRARKASGQLESPLVKGADLVGMDPPILAYLGPLAGVSDYLATLTITRTETFTVLVQTDSPEKARAIAAKVAPELDGCYLEPHWLGDVEVPEQHWMVAGVPEVHPDLEVNFQDTLSYQFSVGVESLFEDADANCETCSPAAEQEPLESAGHAGAGKPKNDDVV